MCSSYPVHVSNIETRDNPKTLALETKIGISFHPDAFTLVSPPATDAEIEAIKEALQDVQAPPVSPNPPIPQR
jgi:hypothetical protein